MNLNTSFEALTRIGFNQRQVEALQGLQAGGFVGRVVAVHRDRFEVDDGESRFSAMLAPPLASRQRDGSDTTVVGDWCLWEHPSSGTPLIVALAPRETLIARGRDNGERQALVSNVDTALLVMGLDDNFNPNRLERFLALVRGARIFPVVVLSKADLCSDADARLATIRELAGSGTPVFAGDVRDPALCAQLAPWLERGQTLVLLGSSGVGKSTLANALLGDQSQATGAVSELGARGRHTTVARRLLRLHGGACLIDTPGLRELQLTGAEQLQESGSDEIHALAAGCRYSDCRHLSEPGCAVRDKVDPARLENFRKLTAEVELAQRTQLQKRDKKQQDKVVQKSLRKLYKDRDEK
ncbi:MAG TPA: ribosome small subunit-dependent GTPase A [Fontimonas sp.]